MKRFKHLKLKLSLLGIAVAAIVGMLIIVTVINIFQALMMTGTSEEEELGRKVFENTTGDAYSVVDVALTFLGTPYIWGSATLDAADCSGFVLQVYQIAGTGISLPHFAATQAEYGELVYYKSKGGNFAYDAERRESEVWFNQPEIDGYKQLLPGDLIFFIYKGNQIDHVGMYIGNGQFIHSRSTKYGNMISSIWSPGQSSAIVVATHLLSNDMSEWTTDLTGPALNAIEKADAIALAEYIDKEHSKLPPKKQYDKTVEIINEARARQVLIREVVSERISLTKGYHPSDETMQVIRCGLVGMYYVSNMPTVAPTPEADG